MTYKQQFIQFLAECGVLKFGTFKLKSGRIAPYFLNSGEYKTGAQLKKLGEFYADCMHENGLQADTLFGPAYKGVPLALSAALALYEKYGQNVNFCFDRKEVKDHGEGGMFVGKQPEDGEKIVVIEDVMTSGKALKEVLPKLQGAAKVNVAGMVITVRPHGKGAWQRAFGGAGSLSRTRRESLFHRQYIGYIARRSKRASSRAKST